MHATFACANAVQANAKIDRLGKEGRIRGDLLLFAARPARIRMDIISPFGVALATLTSDGTRSRSRICEQAHVRGTGERVQHCPAHDGADPRTRAGRSAARRPRSSCNDSGATSIAWNPRGYWAVTVEGTTGDGRYATREDIRLVPRPEDWNLAWQRQRMRVLDVRVSEVGFELYHAELSEHAPAPTAGPRVDPDNLEPPLPPSGPPCDAEIPRKIHVEVPAPESDVRFLYRDLFWNPPLVDTTFDPPAWAGMPIEPVSCP